MTKINKKIITTIVVFVAILVSNFIGGIIGFGKGYEAAKYLEGLDSIYTITFLNTLRNNRIESAIDLLEGKLDWQIYYIATYEQAHYSLYNIYNFKKISKDTDVKKLQTTIMEAAVAYRNDHTCEVKYNFDTDWCSPENEIRKTINNTLKKYERQSEVK